MTCSLQGTVTTLRALPTDLDALANDHDAAGGGAQPGHVGITRDSSTDRPTAPLPVRRRAQIGRAA